MQKPTILFSTLLMLIFLIGISCSTEDPFEIPDPDFTTVPPPFDFQGVDPEEVEEGVLVYVLDEGSGPFEVTSRDNVTVFMSLRTENGTDIYSTFTDNRTSAIPVSMRIAGDIQVSNQFSIIMSYTPGLKSGMLGMKEGERRTIVVSPEKGYAGAPDGLLISQFRDSTLHYDVQVSQISPKKEVN